MCTSCVLLHTVLGVADGEAQHSVTAPTLVLAAALVLAVADGIAQGVHAHPS